MLPDAVYLRLPIYLFVVTSLKAGRSFQVKTTDWEFGKRGRRRVSDRRVARLCGDARRDLCSSPNVVRVGKCGSMGVAG